MKLTLSDPESLSAHRKIIDRLGISLDDARLYAQVFVACRRSRAFLFESPEGFVVLRPLASKGLWIWIAESNRPVDRLSYLNEIIDLARQVGAKYLGFGSDRKGFYRVAPKLGFEPEEAIYNGVPTTYWRLYLENDDVQ